MATAKKTQIVITANAAVAKKVMDELQQRIDVIKQRMSALDTTTQQGQKEFKKLEKELVSYNSAITQNITNTERIEKAIKNLSGTSLNDLKRALSAAKSELGKMSANDKGLANMQQNAKALQAQIDKLTGSVHKQGGAWQIAMKNLTAYTGLFAAFNKIKDTVVSALKKNLEYSGSLTDIRKVSGLTMEDVNKLSNELAKIDTRTSVDGLAQLAYQGAKLGMGKYGVDGMRQFVEAADKINVAIGEEMGEDALPALSKMVETMGLIPKMGIEKAMLATGSAMFKLSSTSTSTSTNIVEFAKRLTGVARTAGITTDQLLAMASASDSLFLMPEVSSTAMSKFIVALQKNHNLIEKDLGIPDGTIKNLYAAGNAMDAIVLVLEKMKDKGNMNALGGIFKDLGSDGQRLVTAMVTMSKNVDVLKDHLYESKEAFEEATAVTNEYEMQQQSAIGIMDRANNLWEKAFVNPDGVNSVKSMAQAWYDISEMMTQGPIFKGTLKFALDALILSAKTLVTLLPVFLSFATSQGIWSLLTFLNDMRKAIWAAVSAQTALNTACKVNPYVALASVLMTITGVVYSYVNAAHEAAKAEEEAQRKANAWKNRVNEARTETDTLTRKLHSYKVTLEALNVSQAERNKQISRFNRDFRQYISKLGIEIKNVDDLRKHYKELSTEIQKATYYRLREQAKQDTMPAYQKDRLNAANRIKNELNSLGLFAGGFTQKNVMEMFSRGAGAGWIWQQIIKANVKDAKPNSFKFDMKKGNYSYIDKDNKLNKVNPVGYQGLLSALVHYENATRREISKEKEINDYFNGVVNLDGYTPWVEDVPGTLENDAPDKDAIRKQKQEERDRLRALREELKQKQDEANAIMDNVRNFYERQVNEKLSQAIALGMNKSEQNLFVEPIRRRMEEALEQVRLAIAGQKNTWETFKQTMNRDLIEKTDETGINLSKGLLDNITSNNIDALRKKLDEIGNSLNRPLNSILSEVFAKATKNAQKRITMEAQQLEARRKIALEHDYTGVVQQNMYDDFNTMGYANPEESELIDKGAFERRRKNIIDMFEKARKQISGLYLVDVSNEANRTLLMQMLFGNDPDGMASRIQSVLGNNLNDWQVFYHKLIQYSDEYSQAQKKQYDEAKKLADFFWKSNQRNLTQQERIRKIQQDKNLFGSRTNLLSNLGLANLTADPEVELMKARMQAAEDYYAFIEKNAKNKQLLDEADKARQEAEIAYANQMANSMRSRLNQMKDLLQPIQDFGSAVGQALGQMTDDADSANEAIKNALKSMLESWGKMAINDINTQMWKAINDAGAKRANKRAQPDIQEARENADANAAINSDWRNLGTSDNPMWVRIVGGEYIDANGKSLSEGEPPAAWKKRHPDGTIHDYNKDTYGIDTSRAIATSVASQAGTAIADTATGSSSLSEAAVGIGGSLVGTLMNTNFSEKRSTKQEDKERKKQLTDEKKHQKDLSKEVTKGTSDREKVTKKGSQTITQTAADANKEQTESEALKQGAINTLVSTGLNTTFQMKRKSDKEELQAEADTTQAQMTFSIAGAIGKCFSFLGPIAGPIAAAVVMTTLQGLLQWALTKAFSGSSKKSSDSGPNTKLVTGMLTYDNGNVQDLKPFVSDRGDVYWATEDDGRQAQGIRMLSTPTATTINGQPSLVAERGPEIVIGRETTRAMMMNNPSLLKALVNYDRNYSGRRAYDAGNVGEFADGMQIGGTNLTSMPLSSASVIANSTESNLALLRAVNTLLERLQKPIKAQINMFGRNELYDSMTKATDFMKNKS